MKKLYSLVVAALSLGCFSCSNEPVEEGAVVLTPADYSLEVSIADSKTKVSLGSKGEDGVYPLYWNEGDKIWLNGCISSDAVIDEVNPSCARFDFQNVVLDYPYNILYPVNEALLEDIPVVGGAQTFSTRGYGAYVVFSPQQNYKEGTFENGTTPMYGQVTNSSESIKLNHLSGVLRFAVKAPSGNSALASMTIVAESGAIAGAFDVDFSNGKLTALEGASNTLNYSFGEGLQLSTTEEKEFFVVLPSGEFGLCVAALRLTDGQEMIVKFNTSDTSAVKAGIVREFKAITFKKGAEYTLAPFNSEEDELAIDNTSYSKKPTTVDGDYLVINDAQELLWLFFSGANVDGVSYNKIRLGANIEMGVYSLLDLPSMKLVAGTEFDGNGKSIKGLNMGKTSSGIFGDTNNLNIHDLTLTDCSIESELQTGAGILAGKVSEGLTVNNVTFNNCSVVAPRKIGLVAGALHSGTFNISNVTANGGVVETSYVSGVSGLAGGLVGCIAKNGDGATVSTATFTNCTTSATVKSYMEAANYFYGKMVGQLGGYNGDEKLYFVNCNGAEATLVPMYDKGAKEAQSAVLSFCEAHRADFCQTALASAAENLLGGERYCRGEVYFEGSRFVPEWDGKRSVTMLTEAVGDVTANYVYSPFDLAKAQATGYGVSKKVVLKTDVDMGGHPFTPITYIVNLDGENHSIYNLKVDITHNASKNYGAGFMVYSPANPTTHKDLTFVGADISCKHDATIAPLAYGNTSDGGAGNAYAGVLLSRTLGNDNAYTVSNVHVVNSKVKGVCKVGGLIGNMTNTKTGAITIDNCSVEGSIVENYDPKVVNYYSMVKTIDASFLGSYVAEGLQWWYTAGECGGLIGFVSAKSATISNCAVKNTQINCTGQENKTVTVNIFKSSNYVEGAYASGKSTFMLAYTTIAGRHVNQFIGDLRSQRSESQQENGTGEYTTNITNYTVSGNSYNGVSADSTNDYNHNYASGKYCPVVGCAYYTGVDVKVIVNVHVQHCAGTMTFNENGGAATTLTEAIGSGDGLSWFGGDGTTGSGSSYYPEAPAN